MQNAKSKITKLISFLGLIGVIALLVSACSNRSNSTSNSGKVSIITTTNVYADIAKNVVGNMVRLRQSLAIAVLILMILNQLRQMLKN